MYEQLKLLLDLQKIDESIDSLQGLKDELPLEIEALENEFLDKKRLLSEAESELEKTIRERITNDLDLKSIEEDLKKHRQRRDEATTQKQLKAIEREMEAISKKKDELESAIIGLMEKADKLEPMVKETRKKVEAEKKAVSEKKSMIKTESKNVEEELSEKEKIRVRLAALIREDFLDRYEKIRRSRNGLAIVEVTNGACSGCHTILPAQIVIDVRGKEIRLCRNCGRLLFSSESLSKDNGDDGS